MMTPSANSSKTVSALTLVPLGGLCNRLRAILSAIALARDCEVSLQIVWLRDKGLNARFDELFVPMKDSPAAQDSGWPEMVLTESSENFRYRVARKRNLWLPSLYQRLAFDTCMTDKDLLSILRQGLCDDDLKKAVRERLRGRALLQTGFGFYPADDSLTTRLFVPNEAVRHLIEERSKLLTPHTVGLHIRRTDNQASIAHSPLSAFEAAMEQEMKDNPETMFYVATDSSEVLTTLGKRFPIRYSTGTNSRSSVEGMQEAVAELFTLISCERFHGSYWSSFSDMIVAAHQAGTADIIYVEG